VAKRQPPPHKDPPGHFYCAQLLHYGLKPLKTKDAAKKRLLTAYSPNRTLTVPEKILELEKELQKEYEEANRLAKKKYEEEKERQEIQEENMRKKRRRDNEAFMQQFLETDCPETSTTLRGSKSAGYKVQLRDTIANLSEKDLRAILINLADDPALEPEIMKEVRKLKKLTHGGNVRFPQ